MTSRTAAARLDPVAEARLLDALSATWRHYAALHFSGALRPPVLELTDTTATWGAWHGETRSLELSRRLFLEQPWSVACEVLRHEMAHQYVDEALGCRSESAHGPVFQRVCRERGIDARAAGVPRSRASADEERLLERVSKLLALAERAPQHEAEAAASAAQRLILKYNLERAHGQAEASYGFRQLGKVSGRVEQSQKILAGILAEHFFVSPIWVCAYDVLTARHGRALEVSGTPANLELAEYVFAFLNHTASHLWRSYQRECGLTGNRDRRTFEAGVMMGFRARLAEERERSREAGLVWVGDPGLEDYVHRRHPTVVTARSAGPRRSSAYYAGRAAGQGIVLRRGVQQGPSGGGGLLPPKR